MSLKKKISALHVFLILLICSVFYVGYVIVQDLNMPVSDRYYHAIQLLNDGAYKKAERSFLIVDSQGTSEQKMAAAYYLAQLYLKGGKGFASQPQKAVLFFEKAAEAGLVDAQYQLALMYDTGDKIPENRQKALKWMMMAAHKGMPDALYGLGVWIERGYMGENIPMHKVISLYESAAVQGYKNAMISLVAIYSSGEAQFPHNVEKAIYWKEQLDNLNKQK